MENKDDIFRRLRFTTFFSIHRSSSYEVFTLLLVGVGAVASASAAVPLLTSTASATVGPARFRAADPPGHRHDSWCAGLCLPRYDAVDAPEARGRRTNDQAASLVLDEACDVLVGR